jgi:hypothetical protein
MPTIPGVVETLEKLIKLHRTKNDDYSGGRGVFFNFEVADYIGNLFSNARDRVYATIIAIKIARLAVVLVATKVNHESIEDTFDDMILYGTIWKADYMSRPRVINPRVEVETVRETHKT